MTTPLTGGCMCGAVRYKCSAEPMATGNCHCRDCQQAGGGAFVSALAMPADAVKITGEVKYFDVATDSGNTSSRGFCPECGAWVFGGSTGMPGLMTVMAGSLDDPDRFAPGMNIFASSARPWARMDPALPKFEKMPDIEKMPAI